MKEIEKEKMLDLLSAKAFEGLSTEELEQLKELEAVFPELIGDDSFDLTAAAIGLIDLDMSEPMPSHLKAKILTDADAYFASQKAESPGLETREEEYQKTFAFAPKTSIWQKFGWLVAALACLALAVNIWLTRSQPPQVVENNQTPTVTPTPGLAEQRQQLLASAKETIESSWTDFNPKDPKNIEGDVVWNNSQQKGFLRFRNLPVNDKGKETYQLWIFDKNQKDPVSGGVFDVDKNGEVIIPIDSALKIQEPTMFGITVEKPGGVMKSDLKNVMAIAKVAA